jgi:endo-1,4-beta-xylanase
MQFNLCCDRKVSHGRSSKKIWTHLISCLRLLFVVWLFFGSDLLNLNSGSKLRVFSLLALLATLLYFLLLFYKDCSFLNKSNCILSINTNSVAKIGSLRELSVSHNFLIGAAALIESLQNDDGYREILAREFNSLTPENAMKFGRLHPEHEQYDFTDAAKLVDFALAHQMKVHGHTLVWHRHLPEWLTDSDWTRDELIEILRQHIFTTVGRFRGQVQSWDVVNEAIERNGSFRSSIWLDGIGEEYIEMAFRWAHEADPEAKLFYNDYSNEEIGRKSDAIYQLVRRLKQTGVPIDGVGFQMHVGLKDNPDLNSIGRNMSRLGNLGVEVRITEMDVQVHEGADTEAERLALQAAYYSAILDRCLAVSNCTGLTVWGVTDQYSWVPYHFDRPDAPLLFDENYLPKPAYYAVFERLMQSSQ